MLSSTSRKDRARGDKREQGGRHGAFRDGWSRARRDGSGAGGRGSLLRARAHVCGRRERSARPRRRAQVVQRCGGAGLSPGGVAAERGGAGDVDGGDRRGSARGADVSDASLTKNKKSPRGREEAGRFARPFLFAAAKRLEGRGGRRYKPAHLPDNSTPPDGLPMALERTFSIIKPDATKRNITGAVNAVIEKAGLRIVAQKRIRMR